MNQDNSNITPMMVPEILDILDNRIDKYSSSIPEATVGVKRSIEFAKWIELQDLRSEVIGLTVGRIAFEPQNECEGAMWKNDMKDRYIDGIDIDINKCSECGRRGAHYCTGKNNDRRRAWLSDEGIFNE